MKTESLLEKLTSEICVSGYENFSNMRQILQEMIESGLAVYGTNYVTKLGNGNRKILLTAHTDEVGYILTRRIKKGKFGMIPIGSINPLKLDGKRLEFIDYKSKKSTLSKPVEVKENQIFSEIKVEFSNDMSLLSIGSFQRQFQIDAGGVITSPALDNRVGCTALVKLFNQLNDIDLQNMSVYIAFVGREETGANGLIEILRRIEPDLVIDVDSAYGKPIKSSSDRKNWIIPSVGEGPALQIIGKDFILDASLRYLVEESANKLAIPLQYEAVDLQSGGTNARNIISSGFNPVQLNIPVSNQHSAESTASISDIDKMTELLVCLVREYSLVTT